MTTAPTVVIDATFLRNSVARSGIGTYTRNIVWSLAERDDVNVVALCDRETELPDGVGRMTVNRIAKRPRAQVIEHAVRLPIELRLRRPRDSVFHSTGFHLPPAIPAPFVQVLHDVIPLVTSDPDQDALRARWKRFGPRYRQAAAIVCPSRYSGEEGARLLGLHPARIHVIYHGVDPTFSPGPRSALADDTGPYVLVVAQYSQRKGFPFVFEMIDELADLGYPHRLRVAGVVHEWAKEDLDVLLSRVRHRDRVEILGFYRDLPQLYRDADCFVMPSRMEGFGLPCLEAMACGTPVVSFDNTSLPEVVGDAGLLVPDGDGAALTKAVRTVLDCPALGSELREKGLARAAGFTWERSAQLHAEVFRSVTQ